MKRVCVDLMDLRGRRKEKKVGEWSGVRLRSSHAILFKQTTWHVACFDVGVVCMLKRNLMVWWSIVTCIVTFMGPPSPSFSFISCFSLFISTLHTQFPFFFYYSYYLIFMSYMIFANWFVYARWNYRENQPCYFWRRIINLVFKH